MAAMYQLIGIAFSLGIGIVVVAGSSECNSKNRECKFTCPQGFFQCATVQRCIPVNWVCDKEKDCEDGSDEVANCHRNTTTCSTEQFTCNNGKCIDAEWRCDGLPNCEDIEDERNCGSLNPNAGATDHPPIHPTVVIPQVVDAKGGCMELNNNNGKGSTFVIVILSVLVFILLAAVIALGLNTLKRETAGLEEEDRFQLQPI